MGGPQVLYTGEQEMITVVGIGMVEACEHMLETFTLTSDSLPTHNFRREVKKWFTEGIVQHSNLKIKKGDSMSEAKGTR